ncbi:enoyl-CoA hydratase [Marinobacter sp. CHS3-4]|nr:enoyl-CoA hydratase [Marinobacter sp. CHS3-4]MDI9245999.1 enoyl-CoA hydratase [Marinobacter sp. CHS3-4]
MSAVENELLRKDEGGAVYLTLNRPKKFNTLSETLLTALQDQLDSIAEDPAVRCVVIAANGKGFCAGHDLKEMRAHPDHGYYQSLFRHCSRVMQSLVNLPVPVIAKVQGMATAAGCQLVASCDLAIAGRSASFAVSGINVGLFCSTPAVALSRNVSAKRAFDMLVTADFIDADTAFDWGLLSGVVDDSELDAAVAEKVEKILAKSPSAIRYGKAMFHKQRQMTLAEAYELAGNVMADNMMTPDVGEGIDAFLEKRKPTWEQPGH